MSNDVIAAAERLAELLAQENDALKRVDYAAAVALVPDKEAALTALSGHIAPPDFPPPLARRLRDLATENREQLALGITVQTRVVQIVARAYTPPAAESGYRARGGKSAPHHATALALSTRA
jgi:hypothetical protein